MKKAFLFPGQGSQLVGMGKELFDKYDLVKSLFKEADEVLEFNLSKVILEGPKDQLDLTINTQPAIFLISFSIYKLITQEFTIENKMLTPTLKLKRKEILKNYKQELENLYSN